MVPCASGILMSALTLALILTDVYNGRINYVAEHAILGGIVSVLFFTMCNYGFEIVNWVLLSIIPFYILLKWLFSSKQEEVISEDDECDMCKTPKKTCGCPGEEREKKHFKKPLLNCPANPIKIGDQCGISRFT